MSNTQEDQKAVIKPKDTKDTKVGTFTIEKFKILGGPKKDWLCYLCKYNLVNEKWVYKGGARENGFKLVCNDCKDSDDGLSFFSEGCNIIKKDDI